MFGWESLCAGLIGVLVVVACAAPEASRGAGQPAPAGQPDRRRAQLVPTGAAGVDDANAGWTVALEEVPQGSEAERVTTLLAGNDMPDVLRLQGLTVQQWIRRDAFVDLDPRIAGASLDMADFYEGPLAQYRYADSVWGIPDLATPEVVYYNKQAFADAGLRSARRHAGPTTTCARPQSR